LRLVLVASTPQVVLDSLFGLIGRPGLVATVRKKGG
jgi:hypothetical protein